MFSLDQYLAVRRSAGLIDRSSQGKIALTGSDRASFLHGLLTNDILALGAGTGCYAAYLTPQGRMIADLRVIEIGDRILLDVPPSVGALLAQRLDESIFSEHVQVTDVTGLLGELGIHGPEAPSVIQRSLGVQADGLKSFDQYGNMRTEFRRAEVIIVRDDSLGEIGFDLYVERARTIELEAVLRESGAVACSAETAEVLRVEAGRPLFGTDMTSATIPLEAGIENRAISFSKGCYVGQEIVVRILHRGHGRIARKLVGLVVDGTEVPAAGAALYAASQQIGEVTSAVQSPAIEAPIALGYVPRDYAAAGTELDVLVGNRRTKAKVTPLPFVKGRS